MRRPSYPHQPFLGDQGERLTSVLWELCRSPEKKQLLLSWLQELTPMDVVDFEFPNYGGGKFLLTLVEKSGARISAESASDGTLRFLAILAACLHQPAGLMFFEELDNGIHPSRQFLIVNLMETLSADSQMVATTHSPFLLTLLKPQYLEHASLVYRLSDTPEGRIKRIMDIPHIRDALEHENLFMLHASGWMEQTLDVTESGD